MNFNKLIIIIFIICYCNINTYAQSEVPLSDLELQPNGLYYRINTIPPFTGTASENYPNGKKKARAMFKDGKPHGQTKQWYDNGELESVIDYASGMRVGKEVQFYPTGEKKTELSYANDAPNGLVTEWYESGQKRSEGAFENGQPIGEHRWWYKNGTLDQQIPYIEGKANGKVSHWYENGKLKMETHYKDGNKEGNIKEWHQNGNLKLDANFKQDKEDGKASYYAANGLLQEVRTFEMGKLLKVENYRSGAIKLSDKHFLQVFNEQEDFFTLEVTGSNFVRDRSARDITFNVDGMLLQILALSSKVLNLKKEATQEEALLAIMALEKKYIETETKTNITPKYNIDKTRQGINYIHWQFETPNNPQQREHYLSLLFGKQIISLYSIVRPSDNESTILAMLQRTANSLTIKKERIDLYELRKSVLNK